MLTSPLKPEEFRWHYNGILSDLRTAIAGRANFLAALGLLVYTEVLGRDILERRGVKSPAREDAFYCFYEEYMGQAGSRAGKIYEHFRHGLSHTYKFLAADTSIVRMNNVPDWIPNEGMRGISMSPDGKIKEFFVNAYWRDFQLGFRRFAEEYGDVFTK